MLRSRPAQPATSSRLCYQPKTDRKPETTIGNAADGSQEIRELGGRAGGIPVIALTADILFGKDHGHLLAGMTDYISKPIDVALLVAALKRASAYANELNSAA